MVHRVPAREILARALTEHPELATEVGTRLGGDPADELHHFYLCKACAQPVDKRDLAAVFHHEEPGHEPLPVGDADRLRSITRELMRTLGRS